MNTKLWPHLPAAVLLAACIWMAFGASVHHEFAWDDNGLIANNDQVTSGDHWYRLLTQSFWKMGENSEDTTRSFYRPIISLSYVAEYALWGPNSAGFHGTNLAMHFACALLVYALGIVFFRRALPALLGAVIFAVHPARVENVVWISGRTDIFCGFFFFLAFYGLVRWVDQPRRHPGALAGIGVCYFLSLMSKEAALSFPLVSVVYFYLFRYRTAGWRDFALPSIMMVAVTGAYLVIRIAVLGHMAGPPLYGEAWQRIASVPIVFARYLGLLIHVLPVDPHHTEGLITRVLTWGAAAGFAITVAYAAAAWTCWKKQMTLVALFLLWIPLTLLPVFKLGAFGDVTYADRFLYIPSLGFALGFTALASHSVFARGDRARSLRWAGSGLYLVFAATLLVSARFHTAYWANDLKLFAWASGTSPDSAYISYNLGFALARRNAHEQAVAAYEKALRLNPDDLETSVCLGASLNRLGRHREALAVLERVAGAHYGGPALFNNLGEACRMTGDPVRAQRYYRRSLQFKETAAARNNLGECFMDTGTLESAHREFLAALKLFPSIEVYNNLGICALRQGRRDEAIRYLEKALVIDPSRLTAVQAAVIRENLGRARAAAAPGSS